MAKKLLVADDSLTIQKVIRLALSGSAASGGETYDIQAVSDGNDAIQQISLFRPDIILIDVSLPGKSAFEVKRAINEHRDLSGVRFVLMSSAFEKVDEKQVGEVGFHGRLTKPFDPAHLREVLNQVLTEVQNKSREPTAQIRAPLPPPPPLSLPTKPVAPAFAPPPAPSYGPPQPPPQPQMSSQHSPPAPPPLPEEPSLGNILETETSPSIPPFLPAFEDESAPQAPGEYPEYPEISSTHLLPEAPSEFPPDFAPEPQVAEPDEPPPMPDSAPSSDPDADIRSLTESTLRMTGLDDFQWSVQEPSLKPPPALSDTGRSNFSMQPPQDFPESVDLGSQRMELPPELPPIPTRAALGGARVSQSPSYSTSEDASSELSELEIGSPPIPSAIELSTDQGNQEFEHFPEHDLPDAGEPMAPSISAEQMEEIIRREVERVFKEVAERVLPDVAERLIKDEIRKLLSEQPGS